MTPMSVDHKGWIRSVLDHKPAPVPCNFMFSPPARAMLEQHYGLTGSGRTLEDFLDLPMRFSSCKSIKPSSASPAIYGPCVKDEFGVTWSTSDIDRGSPIGPALSEPSLEGYSWPDSRADYRFAHFAAWSATNAPHWRMVWVGDLLERATFIRGMENTLLDLALDEAFVASLLRRIADHILTTMTILADRFEFEGFALSDDYGTQHGMIMSPDHWRRLLRPLLAEIYGLAHARGKIMFHHSCGNVRPIIGDLIDLGLDVLHPIQPEAMDVYELKQTFGRQITFCGGVGTQELLPQGTPAQIRDEVRRLKDTLGAQGGYILEPGITLQADVPLANLLALLDEARV